MKRNTKRTLSMLLALVMLLSAVPFVSAANTIGAPALPITATKTEIWAGEEVVIDLGVENISDEWYVDNTITWSNTTAKGAVIAVSPATTTTYTASYAIGKTDLSASAADTASITINVKQPATQLAIAGADTTVVGSAVTLTANGANDSDIQWKVDNEAKASISTTGVFKATEAGTYTVTAIAKNNPSDSSDDVQAVKSIRVSASDYVVSVSDKTINKRDTTAYITYSVKNSAGTAISNYTSLSFNSSNPSVVSINASTGLLSPKKAGSAVITLTVVINGNTYTDTATVVVQDGNGLISMDQDGESTDDDDIELEFSIAGWHDQIIRG